MCQSRKRSGGRELRLGDRLDLRETAPQNRARAAGVGFVVLTVIAFIVAGESPKVTDPTADVISYYDGDRGQVLVSALLFGVAVLLLLWFAAAIANQLRQSGEGRVGATVLAMATAFVALQLTLVAMVASLGYSIAGDGDTGGVRAIFVLSVAIDSIAALPGAGFILAASVGLMRAHAVPQWLSGAGLAVAALFAVRSTTPGRVTDSGRPPERLSSSFSLRACSGYLRQVWLSSQGAQCCRGGGAAPYRHLARRLTSSSPSFVEASGAATRV